MIDFWQLLIWVSAFYLLFLFFKMYLRIKKTEYEFTSIINHTFRTPLTRINWISKELEEIDLSREDRLSHLQNLNNATNKLLEIIDIIVGARDIKKNNNYILKNVSFRDIVEKSIEKYREDINKKSIVFRISSFSEIPVLVLDTAKISFVIDTLIENAIIYTPKDGTVLIDCIYRPHKNILFYIGDTGIGFNMYERMRIFSKFYRSDKARLAYPDGTGLRLYLSKQIVKRHNGKIYAKSKGKGKGSVFFVELPVNI